MEQRFAVDCKEYVPAESELYIKGGMSMFTHMTAVKKETYKTRDIEYEILVFQVKETGEYRIFIAKDGFDRAGNVFTAGQEVVQDAKSSSANDLIDELISIAKNNIKKNEFGLY